MPIYEFRCLHCGHILEILCLPGEGEISMQCPQCAGEDLERVLSRTAPMANGRGSFKGGKLESSSRSCAGGSCTTITLPGES